MKKFKALLRDGSIIELESKNKFRFTEILYNKGLENSVKTIEEVKE